MLCIFLIFFKEISLFGKSVYLGTEIYFPLKTLQLESSLKYRLPILICWRCFKFSPRLLCIYTPALPLLWIKYLLLSIKYLPEVLSWRFFFRSILCNQSWLKIFYLTIELLGLHEILCYSECHLWCYLMNYSLLTVHNEILRLTLYFP